MMKLFISGFLLSMSLCLDLGIVNIAIIKTGMEKGFAKSLNLGLGSTFGDIAYAILSVFGVTLILKFLIIRWFLWLAGTVMLLYLCFGMIMQTFKPLLVKENSIANFEKADTNLKLLFKGFLLALSSPSAIIWFATIGGSVIATQNLGSRFDFIIFLGGFIAASLSWSVILAYISYKSGQLLQTHIKRIFSVLSAIIFLILAFYIFINGYKTLIIVN